MPDKSRAPQSGGNTAQIEFWNGDAGRRWAEAQDGLDAMLQPLGEGGIAQASLLPGDRVIDIGCGCGATSLAIAQSVGLTGRVVGIDISEPMLAVARQRAKKLSNVSFSLADATIYKFAPASADVVFSRFGVMFFADPAAAFANIRKSLKPEGRACMVVWRPVTENPWVLQSLAIAGKYAPLPAPPGPDEPGPFSWGNPERVESILEAAGFADVRLLAQDSRMRIGAGRDLAGAVDFLLGIGPMRQVMEGLAPDLRGRVLDEITGALAPGFGPDGLVMDAATWIVTARNP